MTADEFKVAARALAVANHHPDPDGYAAEAVAAFNAPQVPQPDPQPTN
jgi:hypothetical protein